VVVVAPGTVVDVGIDVVVVVGTVVEVGVQEGFGLFFTVVVVTG